MNYERRYNDALARAKEQLDGAKVFDYDNEQIAHDIRTTVYNIFPELKESEDEKMRKSIIYALRNGGFYDNDKTDEAIAWLEKQGQQKPVDKVEPKFKVGDWVVYNRNDHSREVIQIYDIRDNRYYFNDNIHFSWSVKECDEKSHLWTIEDAKDGDVLAWDYSKCIALFESIFDEDTFNSHGFVGHCSVMFEPRQGCHNIRGAHPATKEQRDTLEKEMLKAGYKWNKEERKIEKI